MPKITIRKFQPEDAGAVSALIRTTMAISNIQDYPLQKLQPLIDYFSPAKVLQLSKERQCLVAEIGNQSNRAIVGTIALEQSELCTFFVHPNYQGSGIGSRLLQAIEQHAMTAGIATLTTDASLTGITFYTKRGYQKTGVDLEGTAGKQIGLKKHLNSSQ